MKKEEFFARLFGSLAGLSKEECRQVGDYYTELLLDEIEDGKKEEDVIIQFGSPEQIAAKILEEQGQRESMKKANFLNKEGKEYKEEKGHKEGKEYKEEKEHKEEKVHKEGKECKKGKEHKEEKEGAGHREQKQSISYSGIGERKGGYYEPKGEIFSVEIEIQDVSIKICPSRDGKFKIYYKKESGENIIEEEKGGRYSFHQDYPLINKIFSGWKMLKKDMIIEIPDEKITEFYITTRNASVSADRIAGFEKGYIGTSNAKLNIYGIRGGILEGKSSNGKVEIEQSELAQLNFHTSNAKIVCANCKSTENIRLKTSNGRIEVQKIDSPDISLKSSNGALKGIIQGNVRDCAIDAVTSNASCNLPRWEDTACVRKLYAHTSNAPIKIEFIP